MPSSTPNTPDKGGKSTRTPNPNEEGRSRARPVRNLSGPRVTRSASGDVVPGGSRSSARREGIHRARSGRGPSAAVRRGSNDGERVSRRGNVARSKSANVDLSASLGDFGGEEMNASARASSRFARIATASSSNTTTSSTGTSTRKRSPTRSKSSAAMLKRESSDRSLPSLTTPNEGGEGEPNHSNIDNSNTSLNSLGGTSSPRIGNSPQQQRSIARMQNSTFALRNFMDDSSNSIQGDTNQGRRFPTSSLLGPSSTSGNTTPTDAFSMSILQFPTVTSSSNNNNADPNIFDDDDDSEENLSAAGRYQKQFSNKNTPKQSTSYSSNINVFNNRQDLREVDQSVNLMDANAGTYESTNRKSRKSSSRKHRQSMVEIFLGEQKAETLANFGTKINGKHKGRNKLYRIDDDSCLDKVTDCFSTTCSMTIRVLCSLPVLILVACLAAGFFLIPMLMESLEENNNNAATQQQVKNTSPPQDATTTTTTSTDLFTQEEIDIRLKNLEEILTEANFDFEQTNPDALQWMAAYDPAKMTLETENQQVVQRFAIAAFFFAMHPEAVPDSPNNGLVSQERQANRRSLAFTSWMSQSSVCEWQGIDCNDHSVVHLNVSHTNLQGDLPEELTLLTDLIQLDLSKNLIHGSLPSSYPTKLSNLQYVWLHSNQIRGSIPTSIGDWTSVYHMDLSENQFTGTLPTSLVHLTQTRLLFLHDNYLEGSIPLQLGHLPKIQYLYLSQNEFTGELPMDLLSKIKTIVDLRLNDNALTGTVPPEIESLHRLEFLTLNNNQLDGELPDVFDRLHYLVEMDLRNNEFSGTVPGSLASATSLEKLMLDHNNLVGDVGLCDLPKLSFLSADCKSESSMTCECCDKCY